MVGGEDVRTIPTREDVKRLREQYPAGTVVELVRMDDPQAPPIGCRGNVKFVDDSASIHVAWENGSSLALLWAVDRYRKV